MKVTVGEETFTLVEGVGSSCWEVFGDGPDPIGEVWKDVNWLATGAARSFPTRKQAIQSLVDAQRNSKRRSKDEH